MRVRLRSSAQGLRLVVPLTGGLDFRGWFTKRRQIVQGLNRSDGFLVRAAAEHSEYRRLRRNLGRLRRIVLGVLDHASAYPLAIRG